MMNVFFPVSLLIILVCLSDCSDTGYVSTIYVSVKSGNDKFPGTIRKPLKSIAEVNSRLKERASGILFAAGEVFNGTLILKGIECSDTSGFKVGSYGTGQAVINGGDNESIRLENCKNIMIDNLELKGNGRKGGNTANGLQLIGCNDCVVRSIVASGFQKSGVNLYNCRYIRVLNVAAMNNGFSGINVIGSERQMSGRILLKDCKAENNPGDPSILDNHSGNGILIGVSDNVMVDHCTAFNNGWDMPRRGNGPVGIWAWESNNVVIQYCISYRNKTSKGGKDGGGFDLDGGVTNSIIQYCLSYENQGAGFGLFQYPGASSWSDNTIRYCVSLNDASVTDGSGSFFIWNGSGKSSRFDGCKIYNNVVYNSSAPLISYENSSEHRNFVFFNNVFIGIVKPVVGKNSGSRFTGNVWWGDDMILIPDINKIEKDSPGLNKVAGFPEVPDYLEDPGLKGPFNTYITNPYNLNDLIGFQLRTDSRLKNRGLDFSYLPVNERPILDFYSNKVPLGDGIEPGICEIE